MTSWVKHQPIRRIFKNVQHNIDLPNDIPISIQNIIKKRNLLDIINYNDTDDLTIININNNRNFNPSIIVSAIGKFSYYIENDNDKIIIIYRECPLIYNNNSTLIGYLENMTPNNVKYLFKNDNLGYNEDARFFIFKNELYISNTYNNNMRIYKLNMVLTKAESLLISFDNFPKEKNWTFFEKYEELYAIRFYEPLSIYKVDMYKNIVYEYTNFNWSSGNEYITMRGGSSPVILDNMIYIFLHSKYTYEIYVLVLDYITLKPIMFTYKPVFTSLNTRIKFICGTIYDKLENKWICSIGIDDNNIAIGIILHDNLIKILEPIILNVTI